MTERVLMAMSGGVDSSVAAARLVQQGYDVVGITLHLWDYPDDGSVKGRCCAPEDVHDARRVADTLGIPHFAFDRREHFRTTVVDPFIDGYLAGTTPSPCVTCNRSVKMGELFGLLDRLDADLVATGHYARIDKSGPVPRLLRSKDESKDQSYFLHMLPSDVLARLHFPLGDVTKSEVRAEALRLELPGATKGESQELCFVPTGRYDSFLEEQASERLRPGPIVDDTGKTIGTHKGVHQFTVGQRRNLGGAVGHRTYVVGVDAATQTVRLGRPEELDRKLAILADDVSFAEDISLPLRCQVAVRYRGRPHEGTVTRENGAVRVLFDQAVRAVVPGQVAVFYDDERVLGGGTIRDTEASVPPTSTVPN